MDQKTKSTFLHSSPPYNDRKPRPSMPTTANHLVPQPSRFSAFACQTGQGLIQNPQSRGTNRSAAEIAGGKKTAKAARGGRLGSRINCGFMWIEIHMRNSITINHLTPKIHICDQKNKCPHFAMTPSNKPRDTFCHLNRPRLWTLSLHGLTGAILTDGHGFSGRGT